MASKARRKYESESEGGWALVSVLWIVAILSMLAASVQALVITTARTEARIVERVKIDAALDAAIGRAVIGVSDARLKERWRVNGAPHRFDFGGYAISVSVQDEIGKIDLNAADISALTRLMQFAGLNLEAAAQISARISDWRSADTGLKSLNGGTDDDYTVAGKPYRPRHAPFQTVDELRLVLGMTPELFARIKPAVTVYSGKPMFEMTLASRDVIEAFFLGNQREAAVNFEARSRGPAEEFGKLDIALPTAGRTFSITAWIQNGQQRVTREAVVMLTGDDKRPYLVRWWK